MKVEGEQFVVYDIERGDYFAHHSRLPTAEYLAQFGHWDYWVDDNPRSINSAPGGPWLYSADGTRRELLADVVKRQWSCQLTAFLKPAPPMFQLRASELQREANAFMALSRQPVGRKLLGLFSAKGVKDPVAGRYRAVAAALGRAAGTDGDAELYAFMESEAQAQRTLIVNTLLRIRAVWASDPRFIAELFDQAS